MKLKMNKFLAVLAILATLVLPQSPGRGDLSPVGRFCDAVAQAAATDVALVARSPGDPWVLITARLDMFAGIPGTDEAGRGHDEFSGTYVVIAQFGRPVSKLSGSYSWPGIPVIINGIGAEQAFHDSAFQWRPNETESTVLCLYHERERGASEFQSATSAPAGWGESLAAAVTYLRDHPRLIDTTNPAAAAARLAPLLTSPNPYLCITAAGLLSKQGRLSPDQVVSLLRARDHCASAAAVCVAYLNGWFTASTCDAIVRDAPKLTTMDELVGLAAGIAVAYGQVDALRHDSLYQLCGSAAFEGNARIMAVVRKRLLDLDPAGGSADTSWACVDYACRMFQQ